MNLINVSTIYGKAGTGKSTFLKELIYNCIKNKLKFVVLTATHSSLENIYTICCGGCNECMSNECTSGECNSCSSGCSDSECNSCNNKCGIDTINLGDEYRSSFKTIYSFFRIDYNNNTLLGAKKIPPNIFIDEFSLIDKYLFKKIISDIRSKIKEPTNLVLAGDALQLNAIYNGKQYISFNKMRKLNTLINTNRNSSNNNEHLILSPNVLEHIHLSIFGSKFINNGNKKILTKNQRSKNIISDTLTAIYKKDESFPFNFIDESDIINKILNDGFVFLSSKYAIIQHIYDKMSDRWNDKITINQFVSYRLGLKRLYLYPGMELILTNTSDEKCSSGEPYYFNGEYVTFTGNIENEKLKCINHNKEIIYVKRELDSTLSHGEYYYPIIPSNLMTIHKSQGKTLESVIVCIDELFDMSMLYTAVTRCRSNLLFFTRSNDRKKQLFESAYINDFKQLNYVLNKLAMTHY